MRLLTSSILFSVIIIAFFSCNKTNGNSVKDYSDNIIKPHHWAGQISRSGYNNPCCKDTFSHAIADTTLYITRSGNLMLRVGNSVHLKYRSTDQVAHTVTYDTILNAGTVSPFGYYLMYYYLSDSSVFSYSGKTLSDCGADYFYQSDGVFTTKN